MDSPAAPTLEALVDRYYEPGDLTRKRQSYLPAYARILEGRRTDSLAILELGVSSGASLLCWRDYLPNATIIGIDIAEPPARIVDQDRILFIRGGQDDPLSLDKAAQAAGRPFDLIIDDAAHIGYLAKRSMHYLFPRWLAPGGWYVIEDFGTGFLPEYPDGTEFVPPDWTDAQPGMREFRSSQFGMVGVVKQLIDHIMQDVMTGTPSYLAIKRLIVEGNIAFIEKSLAPGGAWPGYITHAPRPHSEPAPPSATPPEAPVISAEIQATLANHAERIAELERVIDVLRHFLTPALRLRRMMRR